MSSTEPISALIADDEPLVRRGIREYLQDEPDVRVVGEAKDGAEALRLLDELRPDLVFLDVQMPELDGFEVLEHVEPDAMPVVVFVTAHEQYALRAFEADAIDYLLKPFDRPRFAQAMERARVWLRRPRRDRDDPALAALLARLRTARPARERLVVKHAGRLLLVPVADLEWIEARGNYVHLHCEGGPHLLRETLAELERSLDPGAFVRVHRSVIVRLDAVVELERLAGGDFRLRLRSGAEVTLSRTHRAAFERALGRPI